MISFMCGQWIHDEVSIDACASNDSLSHIRVGVYSLLSCMISFFHTDTMLSHLGGQATPGFTLKHRPIHGKVYVQPHISTGTVHFTCY